MSVSISFSVCIAIAVLLLLILDKWNQNGISHQVLYIMWKMILVQLLPFGIPVLIKEEMPHYIDVIGKHNTVLFVVYLSVVVFLFLLGLSSFIKTKKAIDSLASHSHKNDNCYVKQMAAFSQNTTRKVTILESEQVSFPFSFGVFRHFIVLPAWAVVDDRMRHCILGHELIHIERRDCLWKIAAYTLCSLYWYNPFVWILYNQLNRQEELACDEITLKRLGDEYKMSYLNTILYCCEKGSAASMPNVIQPFGHRKHAMKERMMGIMSEKKKSIFKPLLAAIAIFTICLLGHLKLQQPQIDETGTKTSDSRLIYETGVVRSDSGTTYEKVDPDDGVNVQIYERIEEK